MAKIIEILGNSGSGKTTLVAELKKSGLFSVAIEEHTEHPYHHADIESDPTMALANQVDFLLYRAEQENTLRAQPLPGILDGGLEQDFYLFTYLFKEKGYLDDAGFSICERLFRFFRLSLGEPDLILWLDLPVIEVLQRFTFRGREFEVTQSQDLNRLDSLLRQTIHRFSRVIRLDATLPLDQLTNQALDQIRTLDLTN